MRGGGCVVSVQRLFSYGPLCSSDRDWMGMSPEVVLQILFIFNGNLFHLYRNENCDGNGTVIALNFNMYFLGSW